MFFSTEYSPVVEGKLIKLAFTDVLCSFFLEALSAKAWS